MKLYSRSLRRPGGEEWPHGDRRQEMVFIGQQLRHDYIQAVLDTCLLTDQEMALGMGSWSEAMEDPIQLRIVHRGPALKVVSIEEIEEEIEELKKDSFEEIEEMRRLSIEKVEDLKGNNPLYSYPRVEEGL